MRSAEGQLDSRRREDRAPRAQGELVAGAGEIEGGPAFHTERHLAANAAHLAHDFVPGVSLGRVAAHGHEVGNFANPVLGQEAGEQHVCFGKVHLAPAGLGGRGDTKATPFWSSRMAAKTLGESKLGRQHQSMEPSMPTSAGLR
jgi:hypothetical protein